MPNPSACSRRAFVRHSASCAAHVALMGVPLVRRPWRSWSPQERFPVVAAEPWARVLQVAEGVWAVISDPLSDRTTLCNGGIVAGRSGVVLVEATASPDGARWMAEQARRLTGRAPTHLVVTHYHGDHTGGLAGVAGGEAPDVLATPVTRDLTLERGRDVPVDMLADARAVDGRRPTEIDLGDRSVLLVPRRGHTDSDVTVELPEDGVVFCGDLVWNGMFPNYVDATPSRLSQAVRLIAAGRADTLVPGHGPMADPVALERYVGLLDDVEEAARSAVERGLSAEEAGAGYRLPEGLEAWTLFNPGYFARAIGAWMTELEAR